MDITFERLSKATKEAASDIERLLPQLSSHPHGFALGDLRRLLGQPLCELYVVRADGRVMGMLTLVGYVIPTGEKWQLEDVVIDESLRGRGLAREFLLWAAGEFRSRHSDASVHLTSRPERKAANALYRSLGFTQKITNNYVLPLLIDDGPRAEAFFLEKETRVE